MVNPLDAFIQSLHESTERLRQLTAEALQKAEPTEDSNFEEMTEEDVQDDPLFAATAKCVLQAVQGTEDK